MFVKNQVPFFLQNFVSNLFRSYLYDNFVEVEAIDFCDKYFKCFAPMCEFTYFLLACMSKLLEFVSFSNMLLIVLLILCIVVITINSDVNEGRYLVYPPGLGNKVQFIVGIGVPVSNLPTIQSVTWGYVIKTNYVLPTNITKSGQIRNIKKRSASISRWDFYRSIADVLNRLGLPGEQCIQRSICETAQIKFAKDDIIGEFFHILLLPSSTEDTETMYYDAEIAGLNARNDCAFLYRSCPLSLIGLFSIVRHTPTIKALLFPM